MVLNRIIRPARQDARNSGPLITMNGMRLNDDGVLIWSKGAVLNVGRKLVAPPESAGLAGASRNGGADEGPVPGTMLLNKLDKRGIFLGAPRTLDPITGGGQGHCRGVSA